MSNNFDYIIVGAGSAGCLLANRLSQNPANRVLVLEAGGHDNWIWFHIPVGYLFAIGNPRADWMFKTDPVPGLGNRVLNYPRGKVIGGCSAINAMIYMRGQEADYDGWRQLGLPGWGWDDVLPYFLKHEDHIAPPSELHRRGGEWRIEPARMRWRILDAFADAAAETGLPHVPDFNGGDNFGVGYFHVNQRGGVRWSAARAFLKPALSRPNLELITDAHVERVAFEDGRATRIIYTRKGVASEAHAGGEIILSAGAVATPQLLELSGVGDGRRLTEMGIPVVRHSPGVGGNLQDHLQLRPIYKVSNVATMNETYASYLRRPLMALEYAFRRTGPMSMAPSHLGAFARSSPEHATPNLQFHIQPLSLDRFGESLHRFPAITTSVCNLRPTSRGYVHAQSRNPRAPPRIQPNYLATNEDQTVAIDALRFTRRIMAAPTLAAFQPIEYRPGADIETDEALLDAARQIGSTIFHPVGTAKMGLETDPNAVVDARLRVFGVENLRVVDASVMPSIVSGNTNAPTLMIAEKAADMITGSA